MDREHVAQRLLERFPALGILASEFPLGLRRRENLSKWRFSPSDLEVLYVYGLCIEAYKRLRPWLDENKERRLIFLESEEGAIGSFLQEEGAFELLSDLQVELSLLPKGRGLDGALQSLAEKHPVKKLDVTAIPSQNKSRFRSIRMKLLRKTTLTHALFMDRSHGYQPFLNFIQNVGRLTDSFYINSMKGVFAGVPALICGAGPSLKSDLETIRSLENRCLIFAGGSAIAALSASGIWPHFCIAIDPNLEEFERMKNSFAFEIPFLYSTRVHPGIFQTANGPFGYLRSGIGGVSELWIEEELGLKEPLTGEHLSSESITVTAIAVSAAQWLGCNPILFAGLDMAYTGGVRYTPGVGVSEEAKELKEVRTAADRIVFKKDRKGLKVQSAVRWIMESASLSHYAKAHPEVTFINTTTGGIGFEQIGYKPLATVVEELKGQYDVRGQVHASISQAKMSSTALAIPEKIEELSMSLKKVIEHLEVLSGEKKGSSALAEMDMKEEIAYSALFYDIPQVLTQMLRLETTENRWPTFLKLARQYLKVMGCSCSTSKAPY